MELLILLLAMLVRALFIQPKSRAVGVRKGINLIVERLIGQDQIKLMVLFGVVLVLGYGVFILFGSYLVFILEVLLFVYFFSILHIDFNSSLLTDSLSKEEIIQRLADYSDRYEEDSDHKEQSYKVLASKLHAYWLSHFFTSSFVLIFWYFLTGWFGLLIYGLVYYIQPKFTPRWLQLLRQFLEMPVGILAALSCAVAGRMDAVIGELFAWKIKKFEQGYTVFNAAVTASTELKFTEAAFYQGMLSIKKLCIRSLYVWLFVIALIIIA